MSLLSRLREASEWGNTSVPLNASAPLSLSSDEISIACHHFSPERFMSQDLSSVIYRASFEDDASGAKKLEAGITGLHSSSQEIIFSPYYKLLDKLKLDYIQMSKHEHGNANE